ncbi:L-aspartate oxidase [Francisellaceae bacterium]|nr:L-aspartate oxidase [Francisellaceae bacterium]
MKHKHDVLIIGAGTAGLTAALRLADYLSIAVICKAKLGEGSSLYAQGGIAAVMDEQDSVESHIQDTLTAGAGLCDEDAVRHTVEHARGCIEWLVDQGVQFNLDEEFNDKKHFHLTLEGGHSFRRILHAHDATGREIQTTLAKKIQQHKNITVYEYYNVVDLIKYRQECVGAYVLNTQSNKVETFQAKATLLATGGASRVYSYSTNPAVSSGDGIAMAYRAGCRVANMEFNQFHPTCLYHPKGKALLLSEALRGEGAILKLPDGTPFMHKYHEKGELAPRDIVARAIDHQIKKLGIPCVYLDISHKPADFIKEHFPTIYKQMLKYEIDITNDPIPVVPAAHYTCGGVMVDEYARTDIPGLYGAGEATYTGLHGANRMASNSLLECLVYSFSAADDILRNINHFIDPKSILDWDDGLVKESDDEILILNNWVELKGSMWNYMGIVRSNIRLERAAKRIQMIKEEVHDYYSNYTIKNNLLELRNLILVAELMIRSAKRRQESRGLHYTQDFPDRDDRFLKPTIIKPKAY